MFSGLTREQIATAIVGLLEALVSCVILQAATTPTEIGLCGLAAVCGLIGFTLALEIGG